MQNQTYRLLIVFSLCLLWPVLSIAATHLQHVPGELLRAEISSKEFSRIELRGRSNDLNSTRRPVFEVIGDESKYQLLSDTLGSNIFIKPQVPVGSHFTISLIGISGKAVDLELRVRDIGAVAIIIDELPKEEGADKIRDHQAKSNIDIREEALMLKSMKLGVSSKYYVVESKSLLSNTKLPVSLKGLKVLKEKTYRFGDLTGVVLLVKNRSKQDLALQEEDFSHLFCGTTLVHLGSSTLSKGGTKEDECRIFILNKEKGQC
jgi:hypothetical protein